MSNILATLENQVSEEPSTEEAPEVEETEETEEEVEETEEEVEETEDPDAEGEPEETEETEDPDAEGEPEVPELDDAAEFMIDGERVTGAELKKGGLRQADYTRKTQELAEQRKVLDAEREKADEYEAFLSGIGDLDTMEAELSRFYPKTFAALRDRIIEQAIEEQSVAEDAAALARLQRYRQQDLEARQERRDRAVQAHKEKLKGDRQKTADLRKAFMGWTDSSMKAAGLDPKDADQRDLVTQQVAKRRGETWTEDTFKAAAAAVAKLLGKKPPAAKKPAGKPAKKAALPPIRSTGTKTPAAAKNKPKGPKSKTVTSEDFFTSLRRKHGNAI